MANFRLFYPLESLHLGNEAVPSGATPVHGLQSLNMTTTFNLEQVFELGQLDIYEQIENLPSVEMTAEKVLDGYPLIYHLATPTATSSSLNNRTNSRCSAVMSLFSDAQDNASGVPLRQAYVSGLYVNTLNYTIPVDGNATESVTLVGNDKLWKSSAFYFNGSFDGTDSPASTVQRRQNIKMGAAPTGSIWPSNLPGVTVVNASGYNIEAGGQFGAHLQTVTISTNLGREDLYELGHRRPYYKFANFPTTVECSIEMTPAGFGDEISADSFATSNVSDEPIMIKMDDGTTFDLGSKNKLQSVTFTGGPTGGGVATTSYNFQNFNILKITATADPLGLP